MNFPHILLPLAGLPKGSSLLLPPQASNLAPGVDWTWNLILGITGFFFAVIVVAMIIFVIKYRRCTPNDQTSEITHNTPLEIAWTIIPLILVMVIFYYGFNGFVNYDTPLSTCVPIDVEGHRWGFNFTYGNGGTSPDLYLKLNEPVVLNLHSSDVLHALYIPVFRTQRNLIAGRFTNIWFIPTKLSPPEGFDAFCTQYCGKDHSKMGARVYVLEQADFNKKMIELANPFMETTADGKKHFVPYVQVGEHLYSHAAGCIQCHSVDGADNTGPTWKGLYKSDVRFSTSNVPGFEMNKTDPDQKWDEYLTESIEDPGAKIVLGKQNVMPPQPNLTGAPRSPQNEKLRAIVSYIKSIGSTPWQPVATPEANPELYDPDKTPLRDKDGNPLHPESLAGIEARKAVPAQPAGK